MRITQRLFFMAALVLLSNLFGQAQKSWYGIWKLNAAKSTFSPGLPPKSQIVKMESREGDLKITTDTISADGAATHVEWTGKLDGKDYPVKGTGRSGSDTAANTAVDDHTWERVSKKSGKVTQTLTVVLSSNGVNLNVITAGEDTHGRTVRNVTVFDKQ